MAKDLDDQVTAFRHRRLDQGPYTFVAADALVLKVREDCRVARVHALIATGVNADGYREALGIDVTTSEDGAGRTAVLPRPHCPGPVRGQAGDLRRSRRSRRRDRSDAARSILVALPNPLRGESDGRHPEDVLARGARPVALDLRPTGCESR